MIGLLVVWFLTFVGAWKILNLVDRDAAERDKAAGESDAGESNAGESNAGESDAGESDTGTSGAGESDGKAGAKYRRRLLFCWNVRSVIVTALLLLCLFYPYMYAYYPGVSSLDTTNQIKDYVTDTMPMIMGVAASKVNGKSERKMIQGSLCEPYLLYYWSKKWTTLRDGRNPL